MLRFIIVLALAAPAFASPDVFGVPIFRDPVDCGKELARSTWQTWKRQKRVSEKLQEVAEVRLPAGCISVALSGPWSLGSTAEGYVLIRRTRVIAHLEAPTVTRDLAQLVLDAELKAVGTEHVRIQCDDGLACNRDGPDRMRLYRLNDDGSSTLRADVIIED